jgi:hypothetical protein
VCVQGIPWKYTGQELQDLLAECGEVTAAEVMMSPDGRSKVRSCRVLRPVSCEGMPVLLRTRCTAWLS